MAEAIVIQNDHDINFYRKLVKEYINLHSYKTAQFWAEKVVVLTERNPSDVYYLAQTMFLLGEHHRAIHLLQSTNLHKTYYLCGYLAAQCFFEIKENRKALDILNRIRLESLLQDDNISKKGMFNEDTPRHQIYARISLLKGKILDEMEKYKSASDCYKRALRSDVHCYEAYDLLVQHNMLNSVEEKQLLMALPISQQCSKKDAQMLITLYTNMSKNYNKLDEMLATLNTPTTDSKPSTSGLFPTTSRREPALDADSSSSTVLSREDNIPTPHLKKTRKRNRGNRKRKGMPQKENSTKNNPKNKNGKKKNSETESDDGILLTRLQDSHDMVVATAQVLYDRYDFPKSMDATDRVLKEDPYHSSCLIIHIGCQVALKHDTRLYVLAHHLVDVLPRSALAWYAMGCYYLATGNGEPAAEYLKKALSLDKLFGQAWLALGHVYSTLLNDHRQAVITYMLGNQCMPGSPLPLMYLGMEYSLRQQDLADSYFYAAMKIEPSNPLLLQEIGIHLYNHEYFSCAKRYFKKALKIINMREGPLLPSCWWPLINNLGHAYRKLGKFPKALKCHHKALVLYPESTKIYATIGYVHTLMGNIAEAIEWFYKVLLLHEDSFSTTMLRYLHERYAEEQPPYYETPALSEFSARISIGSSSSSNRSRYTDSDDAAETPPLSPVPTDESFLVNAGTGTPPEIVQHAIEVSRNPPIEESFSEESYTVDAPENLQLP